MSVLRRRDDGSYVVERPEFYVQTGSMFDNPHGVPHDEIVRMIAENPPEVSAQVVFGKYVESSGIVFTSELIQRMFDRSMPRILGSTWMDRQAREHAIQTFLHKNPRQRSNNRFYTGIDFARKTDFTVIFTLDRIRLPARIVYYRRLNRVSWDTIFAEVGRAAALFGPNILCDSTGMGGDVVMDQLESRFYCADHHVAHTENSRCRADDGRAKECDKADYIPLSCCEGYEFGGGTGRRKANLIDHLRNVLSVGYQHYGSDGDFGWLRCPPIPQLEEEMSFYSWDDKGLETDCLMALALAAWHGLEDLVADPSHGSPFRG